jgi:hypothetical protein
MFTVQRLQPDIIDVAAAGNGDLPRSILIFACSSHRYSRVKMASFLNRQ